MKNIVLRVFEETDLRCGHNGLGKIAKRHGIYLKPGEFLVFMNAQETGCKILSAQNLLLYLKSETKITREQIERIPLLFKGQAFTFRKMELRKAA